MANNDITTTNNNAERVNELLNSANDIAGLTEVSNWPLAPGWWLVILAVILLAATGIYAAIKYKKYKTTWSYKIRKMLVDLEKDIPNLSKKQIVAEISKLLRIIAIKQYSRATCASLSGYEWLDWLTSHDPKQFSWNDHGKVLITGPYIPKIEDVELETIKKLLTATKAWVKM